jgi:phosphatidylglycerophosphate synthase
MTLPDAITMSRLVLTAPFGYLLFAGYGHWPLFGVFALAAATDWLDGFTARRLGQVNPRGAWLDQMVDRAFTVVVVVLLLLHAWSADGVSPRAGNDLPLLLGLACAREIVALPGVAIVLWRKMQLYHVEYVGKVATFVQSVTLCAIVLRVPFVLYLSLACAAVGVVSGANYVRYSLSGPQHQPRNR